MSKRIVCETGWLGTIAQVGECIDGSHRLSGYDQCPREATHRFTAGCVHEHLMTWLVCAQCAEALVRQWQEKPKAPRCIPCRRADGHHCPVLASAEEGLALVNAEAVSV